MTIIQPSRQMRIHADSDYLAGDDDSECELPPVMSLQAGQSVGVSVVDPSDRSALIIWPWPCTSTSSCLSGARVDCTVVASDASGVADVEWKEDGKLLVVNQGQVNCTVTSADGSSELCSIPAGMCASLGCLSSKGDKWLREHCHSYATKYPALS